MTDFVSTPATLAGAATGITVLGVATGLSPVVVGVSFCATIAAISYLEEMSRLKLLLSVFAGTIFGSTGGPLAVAMVLSYANQAPWAEGLKHPLADAFSAALVGFLSPIVLPGLRAITKNVMALANQRVGAAVEKKDV